MAPSGQINLPKGQRFLFILGAMKSGTSSLAGVLNQHPDIMLGTQKEPAFFTEGGSEISDVAAYLRLWKQPFLKRLIGPRPKYLLDASTAYSKYPFRGDCAGMIRGCTTGARFIYLMRDPVDRIESQVAHIVAASEAAAEKYQRRGDALRYYRRALQISSYAGQLQQYEAEWQAGRVLLLRLDDLKANPQETLAKVWDFLEIAPPKEPIALERKNARKTHLDHVRKVRLLSEIRATLHEALADDMATLSETYGVNVSDWGF